MWAVLHTRLWGGGAVALTGLRGGAVRETRQGPTVSVPKNRNIEHSIEYNGLPRPPASM